MLKFWFLLLEAWKMLLVEWWMCEGYEINMASEPRAHENVWRFIEMQKSREMFYARALINLQLPRFFHEISFVRITVIVQILCVQNPYVHCHQSYAWSATRKSVHGVTFLICLTF